MKFNQVIKTDKGMPSIYYGSNVQAIDNALVNNKSLHQWRIAAEGTTRENLGSVDVLTMGQNDIWELGGSYVFLGKYQLTLYSSGLALASAVIDEDDGLVVVGRQYVDHTINAFVAVDLTSTATSLTVDDATGFPSSGNLIMFYVSGDGSMGIAEVVSYTSLSGNVFSGLTRHIYNTTAATHPTGHKVIGYVKRWLDMGEEVYYRPSVDHENHVFIGNGHYVAGWKDHDASTFSATLLDLPEGYNVVSLDSTIIGNQRLVAIGATRGADSAIFFWDGEDTTWIRKIDIPGPLTYVYEHYILAGSTIFETDGYIINPIATLPGNIISTLGDEMGVKDNYLYVLLRGGDRDTTLRARYGLWQLDLRDKTWIYFPMANATAQRGNCLWTKGNGAAVYVGGQYEVERIEDNTPSKVATIWIPYQPDTGHRLKLTDIRLNLQTRALNKTGTYHVPSWTIIVRVNPLTHSSGRRLNITGVNPFMFTCTTSTDIDYLRVGDRVELYPNQIREIGDIGTENIVVAAFTAKPGDADAIIFSPSMKKVGSVTVNSVISPEDLHFVVNDQPEGFGFMIEVEIRNATDEEDGVPALALNNIEVTGTIL